MRVTDSLPAEAPAGGRAAEDGRAERRRPQAMRTDDLLVCVVGTADALNAQADALAVLAAPDVGQLIWCLDDEFGQPPVAADWAQGLVVLNSDVWAAPSGCARLQALLKMAWRCGRTIALCGEAVSALRILGFPADVPAEAEGLFLCPEGPCRETLVEFLEAVREQPHQGR